MARSARFLGASATMCFALMIASCSTDTKDPAAEPEIGKIRHILDTNNLSLPLDSYSLTMAQQIAVSRAESRLAQECMDRFGFSYDLAQSTPVDSPFVTAGSNARRYGVTSLQQAKKFGYHPPWEETESDGKETKFSAAALSVLRGKGKSAHNGQKIPQGGCHGEALGVINKGAPRVDDIDYARILGLEAKNRADTDSRVLKASKYWSSCMQKKGYAYNRPMDANDDPAFWESDTPSATEIATSVADVECRRSSNLVGVWYAVESAYQQQAVEKNAEKLASVREALQTTLRNIGQPSGLGAAAKVTLSS